MQEPPNDGPDDWFFDEIQQKWLRHSGTARLRKKFAEHRAHREAHPEEDEAMRHLLSMSPAEQVKVILPSRPLRRYPGGMEQDTSAPESMTEVLNRLGVKVTEEGKARARRRLAEADARRDLPARAAFREQLSQGRVSPA